MTTPFVELDVRPTLRAGGEPFEEIMQTVSALKPGEGLRLLATFKPTPLLHVLGSRGYTHIEKEIGEGDWEVLFSPSQTALGPAGTTVSPTAADDAPWPNPAQHLDNRDLDPPEPMEKILMVTEVMEPGEVLSALLCREPLFLFPHLAKRGHQWRGAFEPDGKTYKVLIRIGRAAETVA
jgi:uncharacterized protein (DUF2249 family)/TusA-related sulfurtransferase